MLGANNVVTVFGGSGFIGRYIIRLLAKTGARIRVAVRHPHLASHLMMSGSVGQITPVFCNIRDYKLVEDALQGADIAINCVGILYETGSQTFFQTQAQGAEHIAHAAMRLETKKLIHISAIGAAENSESAYARTKGQAEQMCLRYFPQVTIFRPSIIFGPEDDFFNRFASMASISPFLPLIGGGKTKFQPVYVGDIARAVLQATHDASMEQKIYELGGPEILSFKKLMQKMLYHIGKKRLLMPIPFALAYLQARLLQLFPKPLLTVDQVRMLEHDNIVSDLCLGFKDFGMTTTSLDNILPTYLGRFRAFAPYDCGKGYEYKSQDKA